MKPRCFRLVLGTLLTLLVCGRLGAIDNPQNGIPVRVWAAGTSGSSTGMQTLPYSYLPATAPTPPGYTLVSLVYAYGVLYQQLRSNASSTVAAYINLSATLLPWEVPSAGQPPVRIDGTTTAAASVGSPAQSMTADCGMVRMEPGKTYDISVSYANIVGGTVNVVPPPGYKVVLNGMVRNGCAIANTVNVRVLPISGGHPQLAGSASSVATLKVDWRLALGTLSDGSDAGFIELVDTGKATNWDTICTPGALSYAATSGEVFVYRQGAALRQIIANQIAVDIVTLTATSYELRCYSPDQIQSYVPCGFSGQPFAVYRVEKGATDTSLKFTRETRNITNPTATNVPIARAETMTLQRADSAGNYTWTKNDWTVVGQAALSSTVAQSVASGSNRTETIQVATPGGAKALQLTRNYALLASGEEMNQEILGTSNSPTVGVAYFSDINQPGTFGYVNSIALPGGGWEAYDYYDTTLTTGYQVGQVKMKYRPFGNLPAAVTKDPAQGEVAYYEYDVDPFGFRTRLKTQQTFVNGVETSRSTISYADGSGTGPTYAPGSVLVTQKNYVGSGTYLTTTSLRYSEGDANAYLRGKTVWVQQPDGVTVNYTYERGSWNGMGFTANVAPNRATRVSVTTNQVVANKSTKDVTIRDERAQVVRTETYVWANSSWNLVTYVDFTYNFMGLLMTKVGNNGATYTATYDGLLKTSETDENGNVTSYLYDAAGRVSIVTKGGSGAVPSLSTRYVYDAAGNVLQEQIGAGLSEQIVSTKQYDDAGRLIAETSPAQGTTTHAYDVANRTHTVTRPDGGTVTDSANRDGRPAGKAGTAVVPQFMFYGVEPTTGQRWMRTHTGLAESKRWQQSYKDWAGRDAALARPKPGSTATSFDGNVAPTNTNIFLQRSYYNDVAGSGSSTGHLVKTTESDMAATLYTYDTFGKVVRTGLDVTGNDALDLASTDRVSDQDVSYEFTSDAWWLRQETKAYAQSTSSTPSTMSVTRTRLTGFSAGRLEEVQTTDTVGNITTKTRDVQRATATVTLTTTTTGIGQAAIETQLAGLTMSTRSPAGLTTSTTYDNLRRPSIVTDSRGNQTKTNYQTGTALVSLVIQPYLGPTDSHNITVATYTYDSSARRISETNAGGYTTYTSYTPQGQVYRIWGSATYPVEYGYDAAYGEKVTMKTFRAGTGWDVNAWPGTTGNTGNSPGTPDTTTWAYDPATGVLLSKTDALSRAVTYTYNRRTQLATRTWARGVTTTYAYDSATAEQRDILYSDSTPELHYTYNRLGQNTQVEDATGIRTLAHCLCGKLASEQLAASFYGSRLLTYKLSSATGSVLGRTMGYTLSFMGGMEQDVAYNYDAASGRFSDLSTQSTISAAAHAFHYAYLANAEIVASLSVDAGHPFTITRTFETNRDVLSSIDAKWSTTSRVRYDYTVNALGQRTGIKQSGNAFADYGDDTYRDLAYNSRGELTADTGYLGNGVDGSKVLPDRQHAFAYDNIGNRQWSNVTGNSTLRDDYTTNVLNQYTGKENNVITVSGTADANAKVVVADRTAAAYRKGAFWSDDITVANVLRPWRGPLTIYTGKTGAGSGGADLLRTEVRMAQVPQQAQTFTYDNDGNLTSDGVWDYAWDAENRLVRMTATTAAVTGGYPNRRLEFSYDYLGRRVQKLLLDNGSNQILSARRFVYNGWNLIAEYALNSQLAGARLARSYTWGLDIVHTLEQSGGVGALLQIADHASVKAYLPAYDGNGNITALVDADTSQNGACVATYEYSPYGEFLRADGTYAKDNPFRFSSKFTDEETGLVYYGRRYYSPRQGRFLGRDPSEETGGLNLYGFCRNNGINLWDRLGMDPSYEYVNDYSSGTAVTIKYEVFQGQAIYDYVMRGGANPDWSNMSQGDSLYLGRLQSEEGVASAFDYNLGWHEGMSGSPGSIPAEALLPTVTESQAQEMVGAQANVRAGDTFSINTATGALVGLNGQFTDRVGNVDVGTPIVVPDGAWAPASAPSPQGPVVLTAEDRAYISQSNAISNRFNALRDARSRTYDLQVQQNALSNFNGLMGLAWAGETFANAATSALSLGAAALRNAPIAGIRAVATVNSAVTADEIAAGRAIQKIPGVIERNVQVVNELHARLEARGYTPEQIYKMLGKLNGGGTGWDGPTPGGPP